MAIITISRGPFSGVEVLTQRLADELGYGLLSREEMLTNAAKEFGLSQSQLESALTHAPGFLEGRGLKKLQYVHCVRATMAKAVQADNIVYHGEAGHLLLKGIPHQLRVSVVASIESRISIAMEQCQLTRAKAIEYLRASDEKRDNWQKWVHGVDAKDPGSYDLMINLEHIPIPSACMTIAETAARDFQTTSQSQKLVDDLVLVSEIRAKMALDRSVSDDRIQVEANSGVVTITANVRQLAHAENVRELVSQMPSVKEVRSEERTAL
jgi:cytidylate kinase